MGFADVITADTARYRQTPHGGGSGVSKRWSLVLRKLRGSLSSTSPVPLHLLHVVAIADSPFTCG
jgi:hypothetical protein